MMGGRGDRCGPVLECGRGLCQRWAGRVTENSGLDMELGPHRLSVLVLGY